MIVGIVFDDTVEIFVQYLPDGSGTGYSGVAMDHQDLPPVDPLQEADDPQRVSAIERDERSPVFVFPRNIRFGDIVELQFEDIVPIGQRRKIPRRKDADEIELQTEYPIRVQALFDPFSRFYQYAHAVYDPLC